MDKREFDRLVTGSLQYEMGHGVLTLTGYYTGESVKLDLTRLSEEMLEELIVTDDDEDIYEEW